MEIQLFETRSGRACGLPCDRGSVVDTLARVRVEPVQRMVAVSAQLYGFAYLQRVFARQPDGTADHNRRVAMPAMYQLLGAQNLDHFDRDRYAARMQLDVFG